MKIRRYMANNMQEAIQKVKMDLGSDAVILNTRKVKRPASCGTVYVSTNRRNGYYKSGVQHTTDRPQESYTRCKTSIHYTGKRIQKQCYPSRWRIACFVVKGGVKTFLSNLQYNLMTLNQQQQTGYNKGIKKGQIYVYKQSSIFRRWGRRKP